MNRIPNSKKLSPGPTVRTPMGGINTPVHTGNILTRPVSTVLFRPLVKPIDLSSLKKDN